MPAFVETLLSAVLQLAAFACVPLLVWLCTARHTPFLSWIGLYRPRFSRPLWQIVLAIGMAAFVYIGLMLLLLLRLSPGLTSATDFAGKGFSALPSILLFAFVQTSLAEELFFRGFLCKILSRQWGFLLGNVLQALLFGLLHGVPYGLASQSLLTGTLLTLLPFAIGFLQGWLNEKEASGSIVPSWMLHGLMNLLSSCASLFL